MEEVVFTMWGSVQKNDENSSEIVENLNELYPVGTFAQIVELQDLGNQCRHSAMRFWNEI